METNIRARSVVGKRRFFGKKMDSELRPTNPQSPDTHDETGAGRQNTHHVYRTNQALTTMSGPPYRAIISGMPLHAAHDSALAATNATPMSLW